MKMLEINLDKTTLKDKDKQVTSWLIYLGEFITIFFALVILTGRIYSLSYWNVFALIPNLDDTFISYAIVSPNIALASVFMALGTVVMITSLRRQPYDIIGDTNPKVAGILGWTVLWVGLISMGIITQIDSSKWTIGTVGLAFGIGYCLAVGGEILWLQASQKQQKEPSKLDKILFGWIKKFSIRLIQIIMVIGLIAISLWAMLDTAQKFGTNEAKMMVISRPDATIYLDNAQGFEDIFITNSAGLTMLKGKVIVQTDEFVYFCPGLTITPLQILIRGIPVTRVKAIQYAVDITPIGK